MQNLLHDLVVVLQNDPRLVIDGQLLKNKVIELALAMDASLLRLIYSSDGIRRHFFTDVDGIAVFDKQKFQQFVSNKEFLPDSYTAYKNKIGLMADGKYLTDSKEVVLAWPYKDTVLEGGQTRDDQKRDEVFWNETLAPDEIDRLLSPKALSNFRRITNANINGEVTSLSNSDNFVIKGNNLLAVHTLHPVYLNRVKLIYIDPPYNTGKDSFMYNDRFNHSTWLTFMRNRLEIARTLLKPNAGVIAISINHQEVFHLKVLCDEIFGRDNFVACVTVQNNSKGRVLDANFSISNEYLLFYSRGFLDKQQQLSIVKTDEEIKRDYPFEDLGGRYDLRELRNTHREFGRHNRKNLWFPLWVNPSDQSVSLKESETHTEEIWPLWDDGFEGCWTWGDTKCEVEGDLLVGQIVKGSWKVFRKAYATDETGANVSKKLKTIWFSKDFLTERGQSALDSLIGKGNFSFPKPPEYIKTIVDLATNSHERDIVLDFFGGSGTTGQAVLELNARDGGNRRFILCEQMQYIETAMIPRLQGVIKRNDLDVSLIYCELTPANQTFVEEVTAANDATEIHNIWIRMSQNAFLSHKIAQGEIEIGGSAFAALDLQTQKRLLIEVLDKNMLYVPLSEIDDETYAISDEDKELNAQFHGHR